MSASAAPLRASPAPHLHIAGEICPWCEQPIPHDKFEEIKERIEARERERSAEITERLDEQFARKQADADTKAKAELEQARREGAAAVEHLKQEAATREPVIRAEAKQKAEAEAAEKIAAAERTHQESTAGLQKQLEVENAAKLAAEKSGTELKAQLERQRQDGEAAIAKMRQDAEAHEITVRQEAAAAAEASVREKIAGAEQAKTEAQAKATEAEQQVLALRDTHQTELAQQREALEQARTEAVNAEKSAAFEDKLKLSNKVEELQRTLDKKTAEELGEGAEIDLFETLKAEFECDRIERINRGLPGADIIHAVMHNGRECGKIIYDSKNHSAWRHDFVTKLAADQMAAKADHAVLATRKFPAGARHLHVQDGVILASPARVAALVQVIRRHIVQGHTVRLSNEERSQKTAALYTFITSERCTELFARIDTHTDDLLDLQVKEQKAHTATWKRQGELIRSVQRVRAELCNEIDGIIGIAESPATAP
jgi:hypothetical protein